jgi:hypothetical protein
MVDAVCEHAIDVLHRQGLNALDDYRSYRMHADGSLKWRGDVRYVDGDVLFRKYRDSDDSYLFFIPRGTRLVAGSAAKFEKREALGYADTNIALVALDSVLCGDYNLPRPRERARNRYAANGATNIVLHELGHAIHGLSHHMSSEDVCAMSKWRSRPLRYCPKCLAHARKAEKKLESSPI